MTSRPPSPQARQAQLRSESARLRQALHEASIDTWTEWRTTHAAEIGAFSWGLRQGRRLTAGWHRLMHGTPPTALALPALAWAGWLVLRKSRTSASSAPERTAGLAGAGTVRSRLSRLLRWARWLRWGWSIYRQWPPSRP